jgi:hypothetical protein
LKVVENEIFTSYKNFIKEWKCTLCDFPFFYFIWMVQKMDSNISIFAPKTDRIKRCNYKTNGGLMLINDLAKDWNGLLIKNRLANYTIHNYNDVSISFGDILKQVDNVDMKIVDQYLLKKIQKFH